MPNDRLSHLIRQRLNEISTIGTKKSSENIITALIPKSGLKGPRFLLEGYGNKNFLRMNSNNYLGLSFRSEVLSAAENATKKFGAGPGAVRFISGTWSPHSQLEDTLANFHNRESCMLYSSAYAAMMGVLPPLVSEQTAIISDELNHNCIINAISISKPGKKYIYDHLNLVQLEKQIVDASKKFNRAIVITDGIFSMRGDHAPLDKISEIIQMYDCKFPENILFVVDDSHGVGCFGSSGRGCEEYTNSGAVDILIATLGKAFGVNGGYVVANRLLIDYLRETSPFYIYSNPLSMGEAAAAETAVRLIDSPVGLELLDHLRCMTARFESGLISLELETITSHHPIVPLMIRNQNITKELVDHLMKFGILVTGLNFPVVPKGDEEIRFQISADHTPSDIDYALNIIEEFIKRKKNKI